jgi:hypothetical protein
MRLLPIALVFALSVASIDAQSPTTTAPEGKTTAFTQRLLAAMAHRDIDALASMFKFPASVRSGGITLPIANSAALAKTFDTVFTPELGCALEKEEGAGGRSGETAHKDSDGVSIGHGAVHLQPSGNSFAIIRIDEPAGAAPAAPRAKPRAVDVPAGQVQLAGNVAAGGADRYIVSARQGDVLQARIERFQGRAIGVRVVDVKTGKVLSNGLDTARVVSATAQQPGDVAVDVTRLTFCEPSVSYLLTLSKHR